MSHNLKPRVNYRAKGKAKRRGILVISAAVLATTISLGSLTMFLFAEETDVSPHVALGNSSSSWNSLSLGDSQGYSVSSSQDLLDAFASVSDEDYSSLVISIENDFSVEDQSSWTPVGTDSKPFNGTVLGNGHTISGFGSETHPSLFGVLKGATLQDINLVTTREYNSPNPYYGLFNTAQSSGVVNCLVSYQPIETTMMLRTLRSGPITVDTAWKTDASTGGASASPTISTAGQLWALAEMVGSGTDFDGRTITVTANIDGGGNIFTGIGTETNPFRGSIDGGNHTISNLTIQGTKNVGLVNYMEFNHNITTPNTQVPTAVAANINSIQNLTLTNVNVSGDVNVGGLVGFGKDIILSNVAMDGGSVNGNYHVGGLIGNLQNSWNDTEYVADTSGMVSTLGAIISKSYSTADVSGMQYVGGIVGTVTEYSQYEMYSYGSVTTTTPLFNQCFTVGQVTGQGNYVGGLLGGTFNDITMASHFIYSISESASMANIEGSIDVGGLAGRFETTYAPNGPIMDTCYFSGTVKGAEETAGLIGQTYTAINTPTIVNSYVSGKVISNSFLNAHVTYSSYAILPLVANWDMMLSSGTPASFSNLTTYVVRNSTHRPGDSKNATIKSDEIADFESKYGAGSSSAVIDATNPSTINYLTYPFSYFTNGSTPIMGGGFTYGSLTFDSDDNVTGGTFPEITSLQGLGGKFSDFSTESTNAGMTSVPDDFKVNSSLEASADGTTAYTLPGGYTWTFDGVTSFTVADNTLPSGQNTVSISGNKIIFDAVPNADISAGLVATKGDFTFRYNVVFKDGALRPILDSVPAAWKTDTSSNANMLAKVENILSINYPETITATTLPVSIALEEYNNPNYSGTPTSHTNAVTVNVLGGNLLQIVIDQTKINFDHSYKIDFSATGIKDSSGIPLDAVYYFHSVGNMAPVLSFDDTYPLYTQNRFTGNTTSASKDQQVVTMIENDSLYSGYLEGVAAENPESTIDLNSLPTTNFTFTTIFSMEGQAGYPMLGSNPLNTFQSIPGEYQIDYQVPDPEDSSISSNTISRTYRVYGKPVVTQGSSPYSLLTVSLDSADMAAIYDDMQTNGITPGQAVEKVLVQRYLNDPSYADHLAAFQYGYDGSGVPVSISFDTSSLTTDIFTDGYRSALPLLVGGEEKVFVLNIQGNVSDYEIVVDASTFTVINSYSKPEVRNFFNAYVVQKSTGLRVNKQLTYDFDDIDPYRYNVPQQITITIADTDGVIINGVDTTVSTTVNLIIERHARYQHPEDKGNVAGWFWETTKDQIREADPERVMNYDLSYEEATWTPADLYRVVENRGGDVVHFTLPSGIKLSFDSAKINSSLIPYDVPIYNMSIEPMYDVYLARDANGKAVQQFYTPERFAIPGTVTVSIPLNEEMPEDGLKLYYIDETTGCYVLEEEISVSQIVDGHVVLEMTQFRGRYVMTTVDLDGSEVGSAYKNLSK